MLHSSSLKNHRLENWSVASEAARLALSVVAGDVGKIAFQTDNQTYWRLVDTTPTWQQAMAGPAGAPGAVWRSGAGAPDNGTGINGDFYLRTSNGDVYERQAGAYVVVANIIGPAGAAGADGAAGPGVPTGGTAAQVLSKVDGTDYNTQWVTPAAGGGATIVEQIAAGGATTQFDFPSIPATHRTLRLVFLGRIVGDTTDNVTLLARLLFNNVFGAAKNQKCRQEDASAPVYSLAANHADGAEVGEVPTMTGTGGSNLHAARIVIEIPNYCNSGHATTPPKHGVFSRSVWELDSTVVGNAQYYIPNIGSTVLNRLTLKFTGITGFVDDGSICWIELIDPL